MMAKILWTALVTAATAVAATIAYKLAEKLWRSIKDEPPPAMPGWTKILVAGPMRKQFARRLPGTN